MRNLDDNTITDAVIERVSGAPEPRTREICEALVRHLHAFCKEIRPTQQEWRQGINFLTRVGAMCSSTRQEFVLLSDILGVSMLVDAINHAAGGAQTETTVLGPFYVENAPEKALGSFIAEGLEGQPMLVEGSVSDYAGNPVAGAIVDVWHSDDEGFYDVQGEGGLADLTGRARFHADANGNFWFRSIVPRFYPIPYDGPVGDMLQAQRRHPYRPAHVHFMIAAPGFDTLVTHLFIGGSPYLDSDVVFGVKRELVVGLEPQPGGKTARGNTIDVDMQALRYDFVLAPV
ncbi:hydroxyquinol 1,2-dioxygenase [Mesorhizobium sp. M3A.F.Ca.ET.201.01.1.1]|uniref:intradiol ring-cleavage dioxygenase n=1 Tax=Mesorhizobium sp. M3A.F.Ca.ET.201.01.1.1 TaxID=2563946 RepID=UPI0010938B9E|nr:intradiol ring-cleavage dioxygenase [Mesorhizobium sp. M3A.F.Ca.ET.201.01.1.1]TGS71704.1 hydroxyquinol 1,2-dioxygenase [Mesorhizobium sp. M3A.F.Ca.ET.201.01.1.1]